MAWTSPRRAGMRELGVDPETEARDVVVDADGEVALRAGGRQLVEHRLQHRWGHLLGGQAVATPRDPWHHRERRRVAVHRFGQRGEHRQVQRFADGARLLGAIEHRDRAHRRRQRRDHRFAREGLEEPHAQHADARARLDHVVDRLLERAGGRPHEYDDPVGIDRAVVLDEAVAAPGARGQLVEDLGDDSRHGVVEPVGRLARLEEDVRVLCRPAHHRRVGCQSP